MYSSFSYVYDRLMQDVDYTKRTEYLLSLFEKYNKKPSLLLDLACGTGGFSIEFYKKGIQVIGVDISSEMLSRALEKSQIESLDILYLCQDAAELDLYGTVDGAICCLDSINHITDYETLQKAFEKVSLFLEPDSLFIFDVNTPYKHKEILGNNTFVLEDDQIYCVWQNSFTDRENLTEINLDFFSKTNDGLYERSSQLIEEKAYTEKELLSLVENAGLCLEAVFDDMTNSPLTHTSQRAIYVTKKKK